MICCSFTRMFARMFARNKWRTFYIVLNENMEIFHKRTAIYWDRFSKNTAWRKTVNWSTVITVNYIQKNIPSLFIRNKNWRLKFKVHCIKWQNFWWSSSIIQMMPEFVTDMCLVEINEQNKKVTFLYFEIIHLSRGNFIRKRD